MDCFGPDAFYGFEAIISILSLILLIVRIHFVHPLPLPLQHSNLLLNLIIPAVLFLQLAVHPQNQIFLLEHLLDQQPPLLLQERIVESQLPNLFLHLLVLRENLRAVGQRRRDLPVDLLIV